MRLSTKQEATPVYRVVAHWKIGSRPIPGTFSRNAYRSGSRHNTCRTETCWVLTDEIEKTPDYLRARYLWLKYNSEFTSWEKSFVPNIGKILSKGKPINDNQQKQLDRLFLKYKVPLNAQASVEEISI